jgi:fibronectin type 3 domain-containing protein
MAIVAAQAPLLVATFEGNPPAISANQEPVNHDLTMEVRQAPTDNGTPAEITATAKTTDLLDAINTTEEIPQSLHKDAQRALQITDP